MIGGGIHLECSILVKTKFGHIVYDTARNMEDKVSSVLQNKEWHTRN
jgi:hypothetical protein